MKIQFTWLAAMAVVVMGSACVDTGSPVATAPQSVEGSAPTSVISSATGEPIAINVPTHVLASSQTLAPGDIVCPAGAGDCNDPCTVDPASCTQPTPVCDTTVGWSRSVRVGQYPDQTLEANGTLTALDCGYLVMTGIGGRIELSGGDSNWSTLALEGRRLYRDGTWSAPIARRYGTSPEFALEAWGAVPQGYAIVGVSAGQGVNQDGEDSHDLRTLVIRYRQLVVVAGVPQLTGPVYTSNFGVNPYGSVTVDFLTTADNEVFGGAGFRAFNPVGVANSRTTTMEARLGLLQ